MVADKIRFFPLDLAYKVVDGNPHVYVFGKTIDARQVCVIDENFRPYFYVFLKRDTDIGAFQEKVKKVKVEHDEREAEVTDAETVSRNYLGKEKKAVKVFVKIPSDVPVIREVIKEWEMIEGIYEYDIPFTRRYLLDKKITPLTLVEAEGEYVTRRFRTAAFKANKMEQFSSDTIENPRILSFDIETYSPAGTRFIPEEHPIIMLAFYGDNFKKVVTWKHFKTDEEHIEFVDGEAELLNKFKEIIEHYKPDIITGYFSDGFDFPYIITRAKKYKIELDIGLDYSAINFRKGRTEAIQLTGIVHLDVFKFVSKILSRSIETDSYGLDDVSKQILGEAKEAVEIDGLSEAWDNNPEELEKFCKYNLQDANLTYKLCKKILPNVIEMVKIVGIPIYDTVRMGFSQLVEWYIMKQVQDFDEIAPNKPHYDDISSRREIRYKGAFVFEPKPGLYKNIAVFDFRSLYPTIITSHNIGLSTLNCECCRGEASYAPTGKNEYWFCKKNRGFIPIIVENLITRRMRIKEILKEKKDPMMEARSESLKLLANAFYGYLGFYAARWYCLECAESVTAYGRYYISRVIKEAQENGFNVLYSDTDSVFLSLEAKTEDDAVGFVEKINAGLPGMMELEYQGFYPRGIFVSAKVGKYGAKKKYALLDKNGNIKITGFETVRRNWSFIAKDVQKEVLRIILKEKDEAKAVLYVKKVIQELKDKKIPNEKVVIFVQLQKDIIDYSAIGPHVAVARLMKAKGIDIGPGSMIKFIVADGSGIIRDRAKLPDDVEEGGYDSDYYINNQIIPSVERIFEVLGFKKEDLLANKDQSRLGEFF